MKKWTKWWQWWKRNDQKILKPTDNITWTGTIGTSRARCETCNRDITQSETKIKFFHEYNTVRAAGKVWCNVCGGVHKFNRREKPVTVNMTYKKGLFWG